MQFNSVQRYGLDKFHSLKALIVASAFTHNTQTELGLDGRQVPLSSFKLPGLLRCLVISWSDQRVNMLKTVAQEESWQVEVCNDVRDFLRSVFELDAPLTVVDLPPVGAGTYEELCQLAAQTSELSRSLLMICGEDSDINEELWARQLGAWIYLPGASDPVGIRQMFAEARKAVARQSSAYVEACGYR